MKTILHTLLAVLLTGAAALSCTKHWEGDFRGAPRNIHAVTSSSDGTLGNDGASVVIITSPTGSLTVDAGDDVEYAIRWQVDGGPFSTVENISRYVPFLFPDLPTTKGVHTVSGEVYQIQAPEIKYPFSFTYAITGTGLPLSSAPSATDGAYVLSSGALVLSVNPTASLKLITGNAVEHSVVWRVDGGADHSADGLFVGESLPLTSLDTAPGKHTITGTVSEKADPSVSEDFTVDYNMGAEAATALAALSQSRPGELYYSYDVRDIKQSERTYSIYRAPSLVCSRISGDNPMYVVVSVDGGASKTVTVPQGKLSQALDSIIVTKRTFGQHTAAGTFYEAETSGRITRMQDFSLDYEMASIQTFEQVTAPRVMMIKGGTQTTLSPDSSGKYTINGAQQIIVTSDFSFSGESPYFPFMEIDFASSALSGFTYTQQKEQHVSTTSYTGVFGSYRKFTSVFYYFNVPSSSRSGSLSLHFTDGVTDRVQTIPFVFTK